MLLLQHVSELASSLFMLDVGAQGTSSAVRSGQEVRCKLNLKLKFQYLIRNIVHVNRFNIDCDYHEA